MKLSSKLPFDIKLRILFTNNFSFIGVIVLFASSLFLVFTLPKLDYYKSRYKTGEYGITKGKLINVSETKVWINNNQIYRCNFKFNIDEKSYMGHSYGIKKDYTISDNLEIEYILNKPSISRVKGTENGSIPLSVLYLILPFFLLSFFPISYAFFRNLILIKVLTSEFEISGSRPSSIWNFGNKKNISRLKYEFELDGQQYTKTQFSKRANQLYIGHKYKTIINPWKPKEAFMLNLLPEKVSCYLTEQILPLTKH